jgi:hypothetical protein
LPTRPANTTGANETAIPRALATARTVWRAMRLVSESAIPARCGNESSNWPVEYSGWNCITPVPWVSSARIRSPAKASWSARTGVLYPGPSCEGIGSGSSGWPGLVLHPRKNSSS